MSENDFEQFDSSEQSAGVEKAKGADRKGFTNELYSFDSLTVGQGYIHEIKKHGEHVFVSLAILSGRRRINQTDEFETVFQYADLLAGRTVKRTLELLVGKYDKEKGRIFGTARIRNLTYTVGDADANGKHWLESKGILETFTIGQLDG